MNAKEARKVKDEFVGLMGTADFVKVDNSPFLPLTLRKSQEILNVTWDDSETRFSCRIDASSFLPKNNPEYDDANNEFYLKDASYENRYEITFYMLEKLGTKN